VGQTNDKKVVARRSDKPDRRAQRFNDARFIQYELDESQRIECKGWDLDGDALWLELLAYVDDGYTFSVKWDTFSQCYACFMQVRGDDQHINANLILSGRGSSPAKAVKQVCFKHRAVGASWSEFAEKRVAALDD
jgi:hypothetical protein